jgi:hypothetical protein
VIPHCIRIDVTAAIIFLQVAVSGNARPPDSLIEV